MNDVKIEDIQVIVTAPNNINLAAVKLVTNQLPAP